MTGERKWHFQTVRHDIWDYDNPPAPILVTIGSGPTAKDAVVQLTKMGFTFVLDRDTGKPLFPVQEIAGAALGRAGRGDVADAARSAQAAAAGSAEPDGSRSHQHHARGARAGAEGLPPLPLRADLYAAEPAGHDHHAGPPRRSRVAWRELRSGAQHALRQRQRGADDQPAAGHCTTRPARPPTPSRWDARSTTARAQPATARRARARRHTTPALVDLKRTPQGDRDGDRGRPQRHAGVPPVPAARAERTRGVPEDAAEQRRAERSWRTRFRTATPSTATRCSSIRTACRRSRRPGAR